jgi:hypothetical protein
MARATRKAQVVLSAEQYDLIEDYARAGKAGELDLARESRANASGCARQAAA